MSKAFLALKPEIPELAQLVAAAAADPSNLRIVINGAACSLRGTQPADAKEALKRPVGVQHQGFFRAPDGLLYYQAQDGSNSLIVIDSSSGGGGAAAADGGGAGEPLQWACTACTLLNPALAPRCTCCSSPRPPEARPASVVLLNACHRCGEREIDVICFPCGHALHCAACAVECDSPACSTCGAAVQELAPRAHGVPGMMRQLSAVHDCLICLGTMRRAAVYTVPGCAAQHRVCVPCMSGSFRAALADRSALIGVHGVRCPCRVSEEDDCGGHCVLDERFAERSRAVAEVLRHDGPPQDGGSSSSSSSSSSSIFAAAPEYAEITADEVEAFRRALHERNTEGALAGARTEHCPNCQALCESMPLSMEAERAACGECAHRFCSKCKLPWDAGHRCVAAGEDDETAAFIAATTKPCPRCECPVSHYHGHGCHHIGQEGACPRCQAQFCFICGATREENIAERGGKQYCNCTFKVVAEDGKGRWSTFCDTADIAEFLEPNASGYPIDTRCGCPICPDCACVDGEARKCEACDGDCCVCLGLVDPGPRSLGDVVA